MTIINYDCFPVIWPDRETQFKNIHTYRFNIETYHNEDKIYYYFEVVHPDTLDKLDLKDCVPEDVFDKILEGKVSLIISNTGHGENQLVNAIYDNIIIKYSIDPKNITFCSESYDMPDYIEYIAELKYLETINYVWHTEFEYIMQMESIVPNTLVFKNYHKKFLSFNGLTRLHRSSIVFLLQCFNLIKEGYVSYNSKGALHEPKQLLNWLKIAFQNNNEISRLFQEHESELLNLNQITLDNPHTNAFELADYRYYEDTYFSLITETSFPNSTFHVHSELDRVQHVGRILSEKIFKPIAMRHPFIVVSNPYTLEVLRELGYKTFHNIIDETYDSIEDGGERLLAIAKETNRLCNLSSSELKQFLIEAREICDYNLNVLKTKKIFRYPKL